jgi:hypothetical protein
MNIRVHKLSKLLRLDMPVAGGVMVLAEAVTRHSNADDSIYRTPFFENQNGWSQFLPGLSMKILLDMAISILSQIFNSYIRQGMQLSSLRHSRLPAGCRMAKEKFSGVIHFFVVVALV